jgi:hypothetical protein
MIDADRSLAFDLQRVRIAHDVDGEAAAARGLAADRAIAELVGIGRVALDAETHRLAAAGTFEQFRHVRLPFGFWERRSFYLPDFGEVDPSEQSEDGSGGVG